MPEDGSDILAPVPGAPDHHIPIHGLSDEAAARAMLAEEIDILIHLNGLTEGARLGFLRWKAAPVIATHLGYIGPVPLPVLNHIQCDEMTIPARSKAPMHPARFASRAGIRPLPPIERAEEGLPKDVFAYTCVSHHSKPTGEVWEGGAGKSQRPGTRCFG